MGSYLRELQRRNVFRAIAAYIVLGWVLLQVSSTLEETLRLPEWFDAVVTAMLVIGFPVILVFSWIYELTPDGVKKTSSVSASDSIAQATGRKLDYITLAGIGLLLGVILLDRLVLSDRSEQNQVASTATEPAVLAAEKSIAVLPFVPMTGTKEDEFFADGLSEELLNVLSQIDGLKVAGRTSAFYYKGRNEDLRVIADALGVAHILEGSVRRSGNQLRVTAQLIKADDGFHLWSETYDRADGDTFVIQDEIASNVANALQTEILGAPMAAAATGNRNVEAQNLYLVAQAAMASRTLPDNRRARDLYARAAVLDPDNPRYLVGYAVAVALQFWNFRDITPNEAITEAGGAIDRALSLGEPSADTLAAAAVASEARALFEQNGEADFAVLAAWADAIASRCNAAVPALERQFPSLQGETLQYLEAADLIDAVLLAHCYAATGDQRASDRLTGLLLTSELLSDNAVRAQPALRLVRVAANAVANDIETALAEFALIEEGRAPLAISAIALPVDELPVFQALYDEEPFRQYARQERYRIAQQARMLASGETEREIKAQIEAAGFVF